jgi:hypothetical protein
MIALKLKTITYDSFRIDSLFVRESLSDCRYPKLNRAIILLITSQRHNIKLAEVPLNLTQLNYIHFIITTQQPLLQPSYQDSVGTLS